MNTTKIPAVIDHDRRRLLGTAVTGIAVVGTASLLGEQMPQAADSQGVPLAAMQELARYWAKDYDWRKVEARLNALPQFLTEIDGLDIHFIHVRSRHENALPLIVTHGWPGSVIEQLKIIDLLTNPTAHGASASDAFIW